MRHLAQSDAVYNGGQSEVGCLQAVAARPARHHHRPGLPYVADPTCMTPAYRILSGVMDATDDILDRFLSLSLSDEKGWESDRLEIVLDNRVASHSSSPPPAHRSSPSQCASALAAALRFA